MRVPAGNRGDRKAGPESGQALVETAIVMPLMVFLLLGTIQFNMMWQARMITKVAAFNAVRTGALKNASRTAMEKSALAVLLPTVGNGLGPTYVMKTTTAAEYATKWALNGITPALNFVVVPGLKIAEVKVCNPTKGSFRNADKIGNQEIDFDDPYASSLSAGGSNTAQAVKDFRRGRLSIQLIYNYRMPIPFANQIIQRIWMGQQLVSTLRLQPNSPLGVVIPNSNLTSNATIAGLATIQKIYVIPIRSEYSMRMQSNLFPDDTGDFKLPTNQDDECLTYRNNH